MLCVMLLNTKALISLGYTKWFLHAMKLAAKLWGDSPFVAGHYAYEDDIKAWLKRHPDFVPSHHVASEQRRGLKRQADRPSTRALKHPGPDR
jgi:hypothetical protein